MDMTRVGALLASGLLGGSFWSLGRPWGIFGGFLGSLQAPWALRGCPLAIAGHPWASLQGPCVVP